MNPNDWRAFCAREPLLANRRQTFAFIAGEGLEPIPLKALTNHNFAPGAKVKIADWVRADDFAYIDRDFNLGIVLRKPFVDVDVDCYPVRGKRDAVFLAEVARVLDVIEAALRECGIDYRSYGRTSTGKRGHFLIPVLTSKQEDDVLKQLHMADKPCIIGNVRVRIEVRRPAEKKDTRKHVPLPGSVRTLKDDSNTLDLMQWTVLGEFRDGESMPAMTPNSVDKLRLAIYSSLMTLAVLDHWTEGTRHETALRVTGVLAHEHMRGGFTETECAFVLEQIIAATQDEEAEERLAMLGASIHNVTKQNVYGYTALGDIIGEDWKNALIRARGGGKNPDALARLFSIIARIRYGRKESDCYVDLSAGADAYVEHEQKGLRTRFKYHPDFPKVPDRFGKMIDAIEVVLHSDSIRTFDRVLMFPGIDFGTVFHFDDEGDEWVETTDYAPAPEGAKTGINVAPGIKTRLDQEPKLKRRDLIEMRRLYWRCRAHLTQGDDDANQKFDQVIARKLQRPREKYPVGVALVGGPGIGKSFFFHMVLSKLIGEPLVKISNTSELAAAQNFRFNGIERVLFYMIDECEFSKLTPPVVQVLKDVMRNPRVFRNVKNGPIGETSNRAVPYFLSNDTSPKLMFDGRADRALIIIRGESQESLGYDLEAWIAHKKMIHAECAEFIAALNDQTKRRALLWHFLDMDLDPELGFDNEDAESDDLRYGLSPALNALLEAVESGHILPERRGDRGPTIREPFTMGTLALGVRERLRNQGVSTFTTSNQGIGRLVSDLFLEPGAGGHAKVAREHREGKVLAMEPFYHEGKKTPMYYFALGRGALLDILRRRRGLDIDPEYDLDPDGEMGIRPPPTKEAMQKAFAFATELSALQKFKDMGF